MKYKEITVERNYHISNDDVYMKEKLSATVELDDLDVVEIAIDSVRSTLNNAFKEAYPNVYMHLNFEEKDRNTKQLNDVKEVLHTFPTSSDKFKKETPIDQSFNLIDEIQKCDSLSKLSINRYLCRTGEEKKAYENKLRELEYKEKMYQQATNQQKI